MVRTAAYAARDGKGSMAELAQSLARSPVLFPHTLDVRNDSLSFIRLERPDYERASFLDARILTPQTPLQTLPWREVAAAVEAAQLAERCTYIFHIGHVGSTLLSRLIGSHPGAFGLREPMILRVFAQLRAEPALWPSGWAGSHVDARLGACLKLLSRTFDAQQRAVIKATSFVSELAADLMSRPLPNLLATPYARGGGYSDDRISDMTFFGVMGRGVQLASAGLDARIRHQPAPRCAPPTGSDGRFGRFRARSLKSVRFSGRIERTGVRLCSLSA